MNELEEKMLTLNNIDKTELVLMAKEYRKHAKSHPDYGKHPHVKSIWFPIDQITKMVGALLSENADGVRIYFGRYPDDVSGMKGKDLQPNTNTVILVSTAKVKNIHEDYYTALSDKKTTPPENRGEQCQPHCYGTINDEENEDNPII